MIRGSVRDRGHLSREAGGSISRRNNAEDPGPASEFRRLVVVDGRFLPPPPDLGNGACTHSQRQPPPSHSPPSRQGPKGGDSGSVGCDPDLHGQEASERRRCDTSATFRRSRFAPLRGGCTRRAPTSFKLTGDEFADVHCAGGHRHDAKHPHFRESRLGRDSKFQA